MPYVLSHIVHNSFYHNHQLLQLKFQIHPCYQKEAKDGLTRTFQVEQISSLAIVGLKFFNSFKIYMKKNPDKCFTISLSRKKKHTIHKSKKLPKT